MSYARKRRATARAAGFALAVSALGVSATAGAQETAQESSVAAAAPAPGTGPRPLALTVSGGVSLGAYEAGYAYYLLETLKRSPERYVLHVATGTSAGSANALLAALASCSPPQPDPRASLFFKTWTDVGFADLFVPGEVTATGLFSRRVLHRRVEAIEASWRGGLPTSCDVLLGVTATRVAPRPLVVRSGEFSLPRIEEKFVLRLRGQGLGRPPLLSNYVDPARPIEQALLPVDGAGAGKLAPLSDAVLASMAFPLGFSPLALAHCMTSPPAGGSAAPPARARCTPDDAQRALFADGGVLDNQPLRLAERLLRSSLSADAQPGGAGRRSMRDAPDRDVEVLPADARLLYIDPDTRTYPLGADDEPSEPTTAIGLLRQSMSSFVKTARAKNLITLFESRPGIRRQIAVAATPYPPTSEALNAFFGFFEKKLRVFDFDLGMAAAHELLRDGARSSLADDGAPLGRSPSEIFAGAPPTSTRPFTCIRGVLDSDATGARVCAEPDLEDTRVLLQVTLDRLYAHCRSLARGAKHAAPTKHAHCRAAMGRAPSPLVPGIDASAHAGWERADTESDFDHTMRLLGAYRFGFTDLGLSRDDAPLAKLRIRAALGRATDRLVSAQPEGGAVLDALVQPALNSIAYMPPRHRVHATIGAAFEVGYSFTDPLSRWRWFRPGLALTVQALSSLDSSGQSAWALPAAGFEIAPHALSGAALQTAFGARTGWSFSSDDAAGLGSCDRARDTCSRWAVTGHVAVSLLSRVRFQLEGVVLPGVRAGETTSWALLPSTGLQFQWY